MQSTESGATSIPELEDMLAKDMVSESEFKRDKGILEANAKMLGEIPPPGTVEETQPDARGIKTRTEYKTDAQGNIVKVTQRIKVTVLKRKLPKGVLERREWNKFGRCAGRARGAEKGVTQAGDEVFLELTMQEEDQKEEKDPTARFGSAIECRHCGAIGSHWSMACPYKNAVKSVDDVLNEPPPSEDGLHRRSGAYRPPAARGLVTAKSIQETTSTIRVTNLSEDTRDDDLRELFGRFGNLSRVYLATDRHTGLSRGFAFITFYTRTDAQKAMDVLDAHGYGNLILRIDWAKPSPDR